ncbi:unnamed protein product [Closterium sp. NIES-54]
MRGPNKTSCRSSVVLLLVIFSLSPSFNVSPTTPLTVSLITFVKKRLGLSVTHLTASEAHKAHSLLAASNAIALAFLHSLKVSVRVSSLSLLVSLAVCLSVTHLIASDAHKAHSLLAASNAIALALLHSLKVGWLVGVARSPPLSAPLSPRRSPRLSAPLSPRLSPRLSAALSPRLSLRLSPHLSPRLSPRLSAPLSSGFCSSFGPEAEAFAEASRDIDDIEFIATTDANIAAEFRIVSKERPTVAVIKKEDEKFVAHDGPFTSSAVAAFVTANKLPLVTTYDEESQYTIFNSDIKKQVLLLATNETYPQHLPVAKEAARRVKGLAHFVYINSDLPESEHALEYFGFRHGDTAIMGMVSNETDEVKFKFNGQITTDDIEAFARELAADRLEPYYLSDPIPEKNDGPVLTVVGKNFKDIVMDRSKDVLLKIDVDHCDDCTDLDPTFKKLAIKFSGAPSLVFARMNARNNEYPGLEVSAFPTLLLYPANRKSDPIDTHHTRLGPLTDFVVRNSAIPVKMPSDMPSQRPSQRSRSKEEAEEEKELRRDLEEAKVPKKGSHDEL